MNIIELKDVKKIYDLGKIKVNAVRGISMSVKKGDFIAIFGPSGSGKSTLMHLIGLLDKPTEGKILFKGNDVSKFSENKLAEIRRKHIGFVFQSYNLLKNLDALENVMLPMLLDGMEREEAKKRAIELIKNVGLEKRLRHKPNELSGGEQQRIGIARALANDPEILLADEPTGNLDSKSGEHVMELFEKLNEEEGKTIVVVTHDPEWKDYVKKIVRIKDGKLLRGGS